MHFSLSLSLSLPLSLSSSNCTLEQHIQASEIFTWTHDFVRPEIQIISNQGESNFFSNDATLNLEFLLSETVQRFESHDIKLTGLALTSFERSNSTRYLATLTPTGESSISSSNSNGLKTVTIDANSIHDLVGNSNENDVVFNWNYHGTNISVTIESEDDDVNNGDVSNSNLVIVRGVRVRDGRA